MNYVPTGVIIAAAAAAEARRKEEEKMTNYKSDDLDGWEFKIIRSTWGKFNSHEAIQKVCRQEAEAGWELLEKFDKHRLRFKRRVERRSADQHLGIDPYRGTASGSSRGGMIAGLALAAGLLLVGVVILMVNTGGMGGPNSLIMISMVAVTIIGLGLVVILKKRS